MNPFLSTYDLKELSDITTVLCIEEGSSVLCSIPGSFQFTVPKSTLDLFKKVQSVSFSDITKIVCYDKGEIVTAGKVFWALKAAGFENIYILLGGVYLYHDLGFEVVNEPVPEVPLEDTNYLPFNNSILTVDTETKPKSSFSQKVRADVQLDIHSPRGKLHDCEVLKEILNNEGIKWKTGKSVQVCGKYSVVVAALLLALGEKHVSVLMDEKDINYLSCSKSVLVGEDGRGRSLCDNNINLTSEMNSVVTTKSRTERRAGNICGNCVVF